jgi:signal transduction histidine kinase
LGALLNYPEYYSARVAVGALAAGVLAGVLYGFLALASALFGVFGVLDWGRIIVATVMIFIASSVYLLSEKWTGFASISIAVCSFFYLMSVPFFVVWARQHGVELRLGFAVSMSIGLALHYAVLRMSAVNSIAIAGSASLIGSVLVFKEMELETARTIVYLVVANITGFVLCRALEKRERAMIESRVEVFNIWNRINKIRNDFSEERRKEKVWVAAIAHELSQPLLVVRHQVELITRLRGLQSMVDKNDLYSTAKRAEEALSEVEFGFNKIINQVRLSAEIVVVRMGWVDVKTLVDDAINAVGLKGGNYLDRLDLVRNSGGIVYTDRFLAVRVVRNLIENAIDNSPQYYPRVRLRIGFDSVSGELRIVVVNLVPGSFPPDFIRHTVSAPEKSIGKGLGVGLAIVRNFVFALPGHRFSLRVIKGMGARAVFVAPGVFYRPSRPPGGFGEGLVRGRVRLFLDTPELRLLTTSFCSDKGLSVELAEVDQLESSVKSSLDLGSSSEDSVFVIEVMPKFMPANYLFGKELHEHMSYGGRYIFLARGAIDDSYADLGIVIDILGGDQFLRHSLNKYLSPGVS